MSPIQTTYPETMARGAAGQQQGIDGDDVHGNCETEAGIGFGLAVGEGTADGGVVLGGPLTGFIGASVRDLTQVPMGSNTNPAIFQQGRELSIRTRGLIFVLPAVAVAKNDPVHYDATTGVFSNTGGNGPIPGAYWKQSGAAGEATKLYLGGIRKKGL